MAERLNLHDYVNNGVLPFQPCSAEEVPALLKSLLEGDPYLLNLSFFTTEVQEMGLFVSFSYGGEYTVTLHSSLVLKMYKVDDNRVVKRNYFFSESSYKHPRVATTPHSNTLTNDALSDSDNISERGHVGGSGRPFDMAPVTGRDEITVPHNETSSSRPLMRLGDLGRLISTAKTNQHIFVALWKLNRKFWKSNIEVSPAHGSSGFLGPAISFALRYPCNFDRGAIPYIKWMKSQDRTGMTNFDFSNCEFPKLFKFYCMSFQGEHKFAYLISVAVLRIFSAYGDNQHATLACLEKYELLEELRHTGTMVSISAKVLSNNPGSVCYPDSTLVVDDVDRSLRFE